MSKPQKPVFGTNANVPTSLLSQLADLADYAANPPAVIASRVAAQSIPSGSTTPFSFDTSVFSNTAAAGMFTATSSTITILDPGVYSVSGFMDTGAGTTGIRQLEIVQNGTTVLADARNAVSAFSNRMTISGPLVCAAGDQLQLWVFQSQGTNQNVTGRLAVVRGSG